MSEIFRKCSKCKENKILNSDNFHYSSVEKNIYKSECIPCRNLKSKVRRLESHFNLNGDLYCKYCKLYKSENSFGKNPKSSVRNFRKAICNQCRVKVEENQSLNKNTVEDFLTSLSYRVKSRSRKNNNKYFSENILTKDDLIDLYYKQNGRCAISGIEMTYTKGSKRVNTNISIDRIDSSKGYTKDNVQLTCFIINLMKQTLTMEEFINYYKLIIKWQK